jgi:hypothetical protein
MALSSSNAVRQLSDLNSQGTQLGQSKTDLIGFYGVTPTTNTFVFSTANLQSLTTGALLSSVVMILNGMGLINCTSIGT